MADTPQLFNRIADRYDRLSALLSLAGIVAWHRAALRALSIRPGDRVLDVGCGPGTMTRRMAAAAGATGGAVGLDPSVGMLEVARRQPAGSGGHVEWVLGRAEQMPFQDRAFDRVTAQFSLRNMEDWRAGLQEMTRVTREGGRLVILEVVQPTTGLGSVALKLLDLTTHVLLFRRLSPYRWLGRSLLHAPTAVELEEEISRRGWVTVGRRRWLGDLVVLLTADRAGSDSGIVPHTASRLRVVWATDGSPTAMAAGEWLVRHIERPAVVHVVTVSPPLGAGDRATLGATDLRAWERALRQAAALLPTSRFVVIPRLLEGDPSTELLRYGATIKPDLMVVGLKRRSPGAARLMGHVGEDLAAKADWPVLAVPLPTWPDARADGEESARQHDADGTGSHGHGGGMDDADGDR